ncbi:hypothetical protein [Streptomyces cyslabdanicus]|uniref:hypothetical protein n=1 Tax=Streptomyces cyslabdanicus TaxID=1470456 RepID=UPI004044050C
MISPELQMEHAGKPAEGEDIEVVMDPIVDIGKSGRAFDNRSIADIIDMARLLWLKKQGVRHYTGTDIDAGALYQILDSGFGSAHPCTETSRPASITGALTTR